MKNLSICIIGKNEELHLEKCLCALSKLQAEIVFVDTGSTDKTKEIASMYTDKMFDFNWIGDFSSARNYSVQKATNDWILIIDCDEYITDFCQSDIEDFLSGPPHRLGRILQSNLMGEDSEHSSIYNQRIDRLFHRKYYQFTGIIHEQLTSLTNIPYSFSDINLTVLHDGYLGSVEEQDAKNKRNLSLLLEALYHNPDDPYLNLQIGQTYFSMQRYEEAVNYYERALNTPLNFRSDAASMLVYGWINCLNELHRSNEALAILPHYDELSDYADFPLLMGHVYANLGKFPEATAEYLKALSIPKCHKAGSNSYLPYYHIANLYRALGDLKTAAIMYQKSLPYPPAQKSLKEII
ncbi:MAG: glycosyltransferase [Lachnospiraceae bacterium]|nr:glycosyltransferase [Lachnospiraceae bacterium]